MCGIIVYGLDRAYIYHTETFLQLVIGPNSRTMPVDCIAPLFAEAQKSVSAHKSAIKKLSAINDAAESKENSVNLILMGYYDKVLICAKKDASVERLVNFFSAFAAGLADHEDDTQFRIVLEHLVVRTKADNKVVRARSCETLALIFNKLSDDAEISTNLWNFVQTNLLPLLRDKCPHVRGWAVKAIKRFQLDEDNDNGSQIITEFLRLMSSDPSKDIRSSVLTAIVFRPNTIAEIVKRMEDVAPEVRRAAVTKLADPNLTIKHIPAALRPRIIKFGLLDRDESVSTLAAALVMKWFAQAEYNLVRLFKAFDFFECEAELQLIANCVLVELDTSKAYTVQLKESVFNKPVEGLQKPRGKGNKQASVSADGPVTCTAAEVFWIISRCEYAKSNWSVNAYNDLVSCIVPDMTVVTAQMLRVSKSYKDDVNGNILSLFRWLLRLTTFVDSSVDVNGNKQLIDICLQLVDDVTLPDKLVDDVLTCWARCLYSRTTEDTPTADGDDNQEAAASTLIQNESQLIERVITQCNTLQNQDPTSMPGLMDAASAASDSLEETEKWMDNYNAAISIRILQCISWVLRRGSGGRVVEGSEHFISMTPWILQAITHPSVDLRCLGVRCLGLLSVSEEKYYTEHFELLNQVLANSMEEDEVRAIAVQALFDSMLVHTAGMTAAGNGGNYVNSMVSTLSRIFATANSTLIPITCEGVAKLLFSGIATDSSRLCSCLLKQFFIENFAAEEEAEMEAEDEEAAEEFAARKASRERLQQVLSLFFHSFYLLDSSRAKLIQQAIPELMEDFVFDIRNGNNAGKPNVHQVCVKLLGFCEHIKNSSMDAATSSSAGKDAATNSAAIMTQIGHDFHMSLFASIAKQIVKHNTTSENLKSEKVVVKDMIKALNFICQSDAWINAEWAVDVLKTVDAVLAVATPLVDKTTLKMLSGIKNECLVIVGEKAASSASTSATAAPADGGSGVESSVFFNSACGLSDVVHLMLGIDADEEYKIETSDAEIIPTAAGGRTKRAAATKSSAATKKTVAEKRKTSLSSEEGEEERSVEDSEDEEDDDSFTD